MIAKSKFMLGVLAGSVALASCTADDEFAPAPASQQPTSAIRFAVSVDNIDPLTRAELNANDQLIFLKGDLMSLYHGVGQTNYTEFTGYDNAIYEGTAEGDEALIFTTKSMVKEGNAVMIYPADSATLNLGGTAAPVITIPAEQNAKTKTLNPYISEILSIGKYDEDKNSNVAGYGKDYKIVLKQVGGILKLNTELKGIEKVNNIQGIEPLKVTKVTLQGSANSDLFTTKASVKPMAAQAGQSSNPLPYMVKEEQKKIDNGELEEDEAEYKGFWTCVSDVTLSDDEKSDFISTTDVTNEQAIFTLLGNPNLMNGTVTDATVVVTTNYGKVTLDKDAEIWGQGKGNYTMTVSNGIEYILQNIYGVSKDTGRFIGENIGKRATRYLEADLSKINMDGLHIKNEEHLLNALKVYDALAAGNEVTWYLDGDKDRLFVMHDAAREAYVARVSNPNNQIQFKTYVETYNKTSNNKPAYKEGVCLGVKFVASQETALPAALAFVKNGDDPDKVGATILLDGTWKSIENMKYTGVDSVKVMDNSTLNLSGKVTFAKKDGVVEYGIKDGFFNNGAVNVSGEVDLAVAMTNYGTITIGASDKLFLSGAKLTNEATALDEYGMILNSGRLGVRQTTKGSIYNYGYIKQMNETAFTYVTRNATSPAFITQPFEARAGKTANKIGIIELNNVAKNSQNVVVEENVAPAQGRGQGFIKIILNDAAVTGDAIGTVANYAEINNASTLSGLGKATALRYIDIKSTKEILTWTSEKTGDEVDGLFVHENAEVNIPKGSSVKTEAIYLKGYIYNAGTFEALDDKLLDYENYFGGKKATDEQNVIVRK